MSVISIITFFNIVFLRKQLLQVEHLFCSLQFLLHTLAMALKKSIDLIVAVFYFI